MRTIFNMLPLMVDVGEANQERVGNYVDNRKVIVVPGRQESLGLGIRGKYRSTVPRSSGSKMYRSEMFSESSKCSYLIVIFIELLFLSSFCKGHLLDGWFDFSSSSLHASGRSERRSMLSGNYCSKYYSAIHSETCASLSQSSNLSQVQLFEINPGLNCLKITEGQRICVEGFSSSCAKTIAVTAGQTTPTCSDIESEQLLSAEGFLVLNPGISCPEAPGNNNKWPKSQQVCTKPGLGNIFFEYIGASGTPISFTDVQPLVQKYPTVNYHYILAFAINYDSTGNMTNGTFYPYWYDDLSPSEIQTFKKANPGVQILMSLGGASLYVSDQLTVQVAWTDPTNVEDWLANAQASIEELVSEYYIDGIDIDFENFPNGSSTFAFCIGTLIQRLKGNNTIGLATIAPYGDIVPEYSQLMSSYGDQVDYVNYQFYAADLGTVPKYTTNFFETASEFVPWKLLASTLVDGEGTITGSKFVQALEQINDTRGLKGVMLFSADASLPLNFTTEKDVLALLSSNPGGSPPSSGTPAPAPAPGGPGTPRSPGSPAAPGTPGSPGAPPSLGSPGPAPSPGPAAHSPGSRGPAPSSGNHGPAPSPRSPGGPAPSSGNHGPAPSPGSPRAPSSPGHGAAGPSPGGGPAPLSLTAPAFPPALPPGSPGIAPSPGSGNLASSPSPGGPPGGPGPTTSPGLIGTPAVSPNVFTPAPPANNNNAAPGSLLLGSNWSSQGFGVFTTLLVLLFTFYAS